MFAREEGSVAAPTAGLHFTDALCRRLRARGIALHRVTLHVGPGTFLPVKADDTAASDACRMGHRHRRDRGGAQRRAARRRPHRRGRLDLAAALESAAADDGTLAAFSGETALFITPGYRFRAVDAMLTNFHLPRSTLFMLVAAFCGLDVMQRAYAHAIEAGYRFYSYGDACLLFRAIFAVMREPLLPSAVIATDGAARTGEITTPHGIVRTPAFMPVGTQAPVKGVHHDDVRAAGADIVLGNTYHLMLRPGAERIAALGGLHAFMRWPHPILTDSGGFQVMSLAALAQSRRSRASPSARISTAPWSS